MKKISIAIIPARGGSKRIPNKNIRIFHGKPMIAYSLTRALESNLFEKVYVTTDSHEIAEISLKWGAHEVINRPGNLADDFTPTVPVIAHAITQIRNQGEKRELAVCCIYPTNPFLEVDSLKDGYKTLMENPQISYVIPVTDFGYPIQRSVKMHSNGTLEMFDSTKALTRSQDLEAAFHDVGQWYWALDSTWLRGDKLLFNSLGYKIPRWKCQDIDTEDDWLRAEKMAQIVFNL